MPGNDHGTPFRPEQSMTEAVRERLLAILDLLAREVAQRLARKSNGTGPQGTRRVTRRNDRDRGRSV